MAAVAFSIVQGSGTLSLGTTEGSECLISMVGLPKLIYSVPCSILFTSFVGLDMLYWARSGESVVQLSSVSRFEIRGIEARGFGRAGQAVHVSTENGNYIVYSVVCGPWSMEVHVRI